MVGGLANQGSTAQSQGARPKARVPPSQGASKPGRSPLPELWRLQLTGCAGRICEARDNNYSQRIHCQTPCRRRE